MTHIRPRPDPIALAASLRLWVLEFVVWLAEMLGTGSLARSMRRWAHALLDDAERGVEGLVVLAALRLLPPPISLSILRADHPRCPPRGFARVRVRGADMRRVTRHQFPRQRNLLARAQRLGDFLETLAARAQRLARRIARVRPMMRLTLVAAIAERAVAQCADSARAAPDTS